MLFLIAVLAAMALVAGACGSSDEDATSEPTSGGGATDAEESFGGAPADDGAGDDGSGEEPFGGGGGTDTEESFAGDDGATAAEDESSGGDREAAAEEPASEEAAEEGDAASSAGGESFGDADRGFGESESSPAPTAEPDGNFADYGIRTFVDPSDDPLSTFALDVDTGSFSVARQWLRNGDRPPPESVRPEEYINAFDYRYDQPDDALGLTIDGSPSPFDDDNVIVRVGVQGLRVDDDDRPDASLTFVVDVSGSMDTDGRLELVKRSLIELVDELDDRDVVSIVTFSDDASLVLEPTGAGDENTIVRAIRRLETQGSTDVEAGLRLGYEQANRAYDAEGINRVILLSDGIANRGLTDPDGLARQLRDDADEGINLITVGVGLGGFNDVLMEQLANQGDGFYAYVDTVDEAERLFEDDLTATLLTIAVDAKIQVAFDPDVVDEYRLIGFENRGVRDSDFRNDDVDAGEVGAGHQVTALYEIELEDDLETYAGGTDIGEVALRWEDPDTGEITEIDVDIEVGDIVGSWGDTADDLRLAVVVAAFAEILRDSPYRGWVDLEDLENEAERLADRLESTDVDELADMIEAAQRL
ncbi:MAG: von Willebrand factor type A domain-containing protein [Acidimicrobiales bacterium]